MKRITTLAVLLAACAFGARGAALAENPLFLPKAESGPPPIAAAEVESLKKEGEALKRKAELLKTAAGKKYASASDLRKKAGGFRSESAQRGEMLRSKAQQSAEMSNLIGDMFGLMSGMGGMGGSAFSANTALASSLTGKMIQGQQAADARGVMAAQSKAGQLSMEAEKKAGPLEMRADELENEGNRLMEAHNRLLGIANARLLLVAADELLRKVDADARRVRQLKDSSREFVASMSTR